MATIAEFTIPADEFPLGSIFEDYPDVQVELERVIPTKSALVPYFWVRGLGEAAEEDVEASFERHADVESIERIDDVQGNYLIRVEWGADYEGILEAIIETDVVLLTGVGTAEEWTLELRAAEREDISAFETYCREHSLPVTLRSIQSLTEHDQRCAYDLTDPQREALELAYECGYYATPSETTLEEMASDLGITGQSLGSRLNRGVHRLIGSTLGGSEQ